MLKSWRTVVEPWRTTPGWEFDLLRTLPPDVAKRLYFRAWSQAQERLRRTWQYWAFFGLILILIYSSFALVWLAAVALGLGPFGQIVLEVVFHAILGAIVFHPLARFQERQTLPDVQAALADELLEFVRDEVAAPPNRTSGIRVSRATHRRQS